jgi:two-component system sporulation sensor kinase C
MFHIYPSVVNLSGTLLMSLIFAYLYVSYRERYMGIWLASWLIYFCRTALFDSGMFGWMQFTLEFSLYQVMSIVSALTFTYGTFLFIGRRMNTLWLYGGAAASLLSAIFTEMQLPFVYKLLPIACFCGPIYIWVGTIFIRHLKVTGVGKLLTGYAYILWGIHTLNKPFLLEISWIVPWGYLIGDFLRLLIAVGTTLVYIEKARIDLTNKEAQYRLFAENAIDVIYRYRLLPEAKVEYISPSIIEITGYTPEDYYTNGTLFSSLIHQEDLFRFEAYTNNLWPNELPLKYRLTHKDQRTVWVEQKFHPIYDESGNLMMREGILRDVTARNYIEQIETQFDRMNMVGEMAVTVAHEVCNPLTTIRGYLQFSKGKGNIHKERFDLMIEELDRISAIINEYLLLAQNKRVNLKNCCLNSIIKKLLPLIETYTIASDTLITLELGKIPEILIDENEIRFLVLNLIRNGVEAMPSGGELTICTNVNQEQIVLAIKDQGIGIANCIVNELGTPFMTTKDTGTGLGLTTCYRIAERHNAIIDFKTSNQGTTFFVYFNSNLVA